MYKELPSEIGSLINQGEFGRLGLHLARLDETIVQEHAETIANAVRAKTRVGAIEYEEAMKEIAAAASQTSMEVARIILDADPQRLRALSESLLQVDDEED